MKHRRDFIGVYENALPSEFCDRLVETLESHKGTYRGRTGSGVDLDKKNSWDLMLDEHSDLNPIRSELMKYTFDGLQRYFKEYYLALIGAVSVQLQDAKGNPITLTPDNFDEYGSDQIANIIGYLFRSGTINIQKYEKGVGGYPHWHSEHYPQADSDESLHRVALYMYYLNDVQEGGETEFFYQEKRIAPRKGTMVVAPAGFTHSHRGNTPQSNDKYIATSWVLYNRSEKIYR